MQSPQSSMKHLVDIAKKELCTILLKLAMSQLEACVLLFALHIINFHTHTHKYHIHICTHNYYYRVLHAQKVLHFSALIKFINQSLIDDYIQCLGYYLDVEQNKIKLKRSWIDRYMISCKEISVASNEKLWLAVNPEVVQKFQIFFWLGLIWIKWICRGSAFALYCIFVSLCRI